MLVTAVMTYEYSRKNLLLVELDQVGVLSMYQYIAMQRSQDLEENLPTFGFRLVDLLWKFDRENEGVSSGYLCWGFW